MSPGAGHPHEQQPPLLGQIRAAAAGQPQREQPSLAPGNEHHAELQSLRGVQRQQRDSIRPWVQGIRFRAKRYLGQEAFEITATALSERCENLGGRQGIYGRRLARSPHRPSVPGHPACGR